MPSGRSPPPGFGIVARRTGSGRYVFETRSSRKPASHASTAFCLDLIEGHPFHARRARIGAGEHIGVGQNVLAADLVVEDVEAEGGLRLRLTIELSLKVPGLVGRFEAHRQSPPPRRLESASEVRALSSAGITRPHRSYDPVRLPHGPLPNTQRRSRDLRPRGSPPITRITLPTCRAHYPGGSERVHASIASPSARPSPLFRRVGIHIFTFEACSGFTHVTARWIAQPPKGGFCHEARTGQSPSQTARQLPDQSTTLWVESSSTGEIRLRNARNSEKPP